MVATGEWVRSWYVCWWFPGNSPSLPSTKGSDQTRWWPYKFIQTKCTTLCNYHLKICLQPLTPIPFHDAKKGSVIQRKQRTASSNVQLSMNITTPDSCLHLAQGHVHNFLGRCSQPGRAVNPGYPPPRSNMWVSTHTQPRALLTARCLHGTRDFLADFQLAKHLLGEHLSSEAMNSISTSINVREIQALRYFLRMNNNKIKVFHSCLNSILQLLA
jgi:hypothetical protein